MLTRREVLLGGSLTLIFGGVACSCGAAHAQGSEYAGCAPSPSLEASLFDNVLGPTISAATGNEPVISSSGNANLDIAFGRTQAMLASAFKIDPGFAYYDDGGSKNAYATTAPRLGKPDGSVLFGLNFLRELLQMPEAPDAAVAAVCAHEYGHILQYKLGLQALNQGQPTVKRTELQADAFAGYFAGLRKLERPSFPAAVFARTKFLGGDNMIDHPNHHGTPEERGQAVVFGFQLAFQEKLSLEAAIEATTNYVLLM
ncbi:neutral zinc metallopeptidase [Devosia aquimaris]|uniref:neutral zinc metallopeptidase n=1 Tax=Devosia aquimaris TaxID=2866214 RepID=UPI001CD118B5|nr:neutral zinc metallopeptidase [Devosia sp. CJK-A8-3]